MVKCSFPFFDGEMGKFGRVTEIFSKVGRVAEIFSKVDRVTEIFSKIGRVTEIFSKVGRVTEIFSRSKTFIVSNSFLIYIRFTLFPHSLFPP